MTGHSQFELEVQRWAHFCENVVIDGTLTVNGVTLPGTFHVDVAALADRVAVLEAASGVGPGTDELAGRLSTLETSSASMSTWAAEREVAEAERFTATNARLSKIEADMPAEHDAMAGEVSRLESMIGYAASELGDRVQDLELTAQSLATDITVNRNAAAGANAALDNRVTALEDKVPATLANAAALADRVSVLEAKPEPATVASVVSVANRVTTLENRPATATAADLTTLAGRVSTLEAKPAPATVASVVAVENRATALEAKPLINATKAVLPPKTVIGLLNVLLARMDSVTDALVAAGLARYGT